MNSTVTKKRVTFRLEAPEAHEVFLLGDFTGWVPRPMKPTKKGTWITWTALPAGRHEYRFLVDGEWVNDPQCPECVENIHGTLNCVLTV